MWDGLSKNIDNIFYSYVFIFENGPTVWSATLRVVGAGKSDLMVGTPYARQPKCQVK